MKIKLPLPDNKKLTVEFRVEAGCLGPQGEDHVEAFCEFAQKAFESIDADFVHWLLVPRLDKSQPEKQYKINNKIMTHDQAAKYLALFEKSLDEFDNHLDDRLIELVGQYQAR